MAVQEFDRPERSSMRQSDYILEYFVCLALLLVALVSAGFTVMSLPGPANDLPLPSRQLSEIPR